MSSRGAPPRGIGRARRRRARLGDRGGEPLEVDRLHQMVVEAGGEGTRPIFRTAISAERDHAHAREAGILPHPARDLASVESRQGGR